MTTWAMLLALIAAAAQQAWPSHVADGSRPAAVAVVNGVTLRSDRLDAAVSTLLPLESFHQNVSADTVAELRKQALVQIVDEELQYQDTITHGVVVKEAAVEAALSEAMARYPSRKAFTDALARAGATLADMRREVRRRLVIQKGYERQVAARCVVSRAEAEQFFAEHPERFLEPERLHIHAITFGVDPSSGAAGWTAARTKADGVRTLLLNGAPFDQLARKYSTDPATAAKGGDMGLVHRGSLSQDFEKVAASLPRGEPSAIVETIYGYHIIRVTEVLPPRARSFADVGVRLQKDLTEERCASAKTAWTERLRAAATIAYFR